LTIATGATFNDETTSSGLSIVAFNEGGTDTGATATVNNEGLFIKSGSATTSTISTLFNNTGTVDVQSGTLQFNDSVTNDGTVEASNGGDLVIRGALNNVGGSVSIQDGTVELAITNGLIANFSGLGGTLQLDGTATGGAAAGVDATSTGTAAMTITGTGPVTSTGVDGIDATSAGGNITIIPIGSTSGAGSGIFATQNGNGNVTIGLTFGVTIAGTALDGVGAFSLGSGDLSVSTTSGDSIDSGSAGILAANEATTIAASADSSVAVTAAGTIDSGTIAAPDGSPAAGILAGYNSNDEPEPNVAGNVTVTADVNITAAAGDGIRAFNFGSGNVTINDEGGTIHTLGDPISGQTNPVEGYGNGLYAFDDGGGSIAVSMTSGAVINSAASGIFASNTATSVQSTSSISVVAGGTIDSGAILTPGGSRPAGILAGYNSNSEPESNVAGSVTVTNDANITATAGDGIRAYNYGTGNVTVTDEANTQIQTTGTNGQYGIEAFSDDGTGNISISTSTGDVIMSASTGVNAVSEATAIPTTDDSTINVTAYGTIDSGSTLNTAGTEPGGILAGYFPGGAASTDTNVNGSVTVNNFANIAATAGLGIQAYNWGNGDVTVNDNYGSGAVTSTSVSGAQYGIEAEALSGGTGDVTVNIGTNASISTSNASNALYGIAAFTHGVGNITVSMTSTGDSITSGSDGIIAINSDDPTAPTSNSISVMAAGTITSGPNLDGGGNPPNGVVAGYNPDNNGTLNADVNGSVTIATNDATIKAAAGYGIQGFTFGTGDVSITTNAGSSITVTAASTNGTFTADAGIAAFANDGGNISITNDAIVTAATGVGLQAQATGGNGSGTVTITNDGNVSGDGTSANPAVEITTVNGAATLTNESGGTIAPASSSASGLAISESGGGTLTIDNTGIITGEVALATTVFNNESGGVWDVSGANTFGSASTIDNAGVINVLANANGITTSISAALDNTHSVDVQSGALDLSGAVTGTGSFTIGNEASLEFGGSVAAGGTVSFAGSNGTLQLLNPASFAGEISGITASGDILDLTGYDTSTTASTAGGYNATSNTTTLTVTDPGHAALEFTLVGNLSGSSWTVTKDSSNTGVDIADPPAPLLDSSATTNGATGTITFVNADTSNNLTPSFTPEGPDYIGTFTLEPVSELKGGASVAWEFNLGNDQIDLAPGQTITQSYAVSLTDMGSKAVAINETVSVSIGGPGNDNFVFHPGIGADTIANFNPQADTIALEHFAEAQSMRQLSSLISSDVLGDATIQLGHGDNIVLPGVTASYLEAHLQSLVHLH
jgi:hypothetical protein